MIGMKLCGKCDLAFRLCLLVMNGGHSLQDLLLYCVNSVNSVNANNNGILRLNLQIGCRSPLLIVTDLIPLKTTAN
jgi:hypothetical protein